MSAKTIHTSEYRGLVRRLRAIREEAGITQSELSSKLGWPQQRLSAIEAGARRLDILEFIHLTFALGLSVQSAIELVASEAGVKKPRRSRGTLKP